MRIHWLEHLRVIIAKVDLFIQVLPRNNVRYWNHYNNLISFSAPSLFYYLQISNDEFYLI